MTTLKDQIQAFLAGERFAVVGASPHRSKYGNKVLRCYLQNQLQVIPVNPHWDAIEGVAAVPQLASIQPAVHGVSIITPPQVTEKILEEALDLNIRHFWIQPGAEHPSAIERAVAQGANVISNGPCILVVLGYREHASMPVSTS